MGGQRTTSVCLVLATAFGPACAGQTGTATARKYDRPLLTDLRLQSIDVAIAVAGPPTTSGPRFTVPTFAPPDLSARIRSKVEEAKTRAELANRIRARLTSAGFDVGIFHGGIALPTEIAAPTDTSTTTTSTVPVQVPPPSRARTGPLPPAKTVQQLLDDSRADAVLIVRAVPVDAFYLIIQDNEERVVDVGGTLPQATPRERPEIRQGRLLVGQAFLFDRTTGARLWSRHLIDLPPDGRLTPDHPFLESGFITASNAPQPSDDERAQKAAEGFVKKVLADFPVPNEGTSAARAELDDLDVVSETREQKFFDENHFVIEVGGNWALHTANLEASFSAEPFAELETGFLAPSGSIRVEPRLSYVFAGGFTGSAGFKYGTIFSDNQRSYIIASGDEISADDRAVTIDAQGGTTLGVDGRFGYLFSLGPRFFLWPAVGGFYEQWRFDAGPDTVLFDTSVNRAGVTLNTDLLWRIDESWFSRLGVGFQVGASDQVSGALVGFDLSFSVGVFL